jgi:hypothetical protein
MKLSVSQRFELGCSVEQAFDDTLDASHWSEFAGFAFIPGIVQATQRVPGPVVKGTIHDVTNSDGSHHVEEVVALERPRTHTRRIFGLTGAFALVVRSMDETWSFSTLPNGCEARRRFDFELTSVVAAPVGLALMIPFRAAMRRHAERIVARIGGIVAASLERQIG